MNGKNTLLQDHNIFFLKTLTCRREHRSCHIVRKEHKQTLLTEDTMTDNNYTK